MKRIRFQSKTSKSGPLVRRRGGEQPGETHTTLRIHYLSGRTKFKKRFSNVFLQMLQLKELKRKALLLLLLLFVGVKIP